MDMYHHCGKHIVMNSVYQNKNFVTEFYDPKIKDHAEKITFCPGCGEPLGKMYKREEQATVIDRASY